jgi:hypothetical protein
MLPVLLFVLAVSTLGAEVVFFAPSAQNDSTEGFEFGIPDAIINPSRFAEIENTTLLLDLDGDPGFPVPTTLGEVGFRAGFATPGLHVVAVYNANVTSLTAAADGTNVDVTYTNYNIGANTYATVVETVSGLTTLNGNSTQDLSLMVGFPLGGAGIAGEASWLNDRVAVNTLTFTNNYANTLTVDPASLTSVGNRTEVTRNLIQGTSGFGLEAEFGLVSDTFREDASIGVGLLNLVGPNDLQRTVVTAYAGGTDPTLPDSITTTDLSGSYYWTGSALPRFSVSGTSGLPSLASSILIDLDTLTTFPLGPDTLLEVPAEAQLYLHPMQTAEDITTVSVLDDATGAETAHSVVTFTTTLDSPTDMHFEAGALIRHTFRPADNAALHVGVGGSPYFSTYSHTIEEVFSDHQQNDGNADGDYTDVGVDQDDIVEQRGFSRDYSRTLFGVLVQAPVAVSWSPVPALTFHAGTTTFFDFAVFSTSGALHGSASFMEEQYTDILDAANNVPWALISASNDQTTPFASTTTSYAFTVSGSFGATLVIAPGLVLDLIAEGSTVQFDRFSATVIYTVP